MGVELRSIFRCHTFGKFAGYRIFVYAEADHTDPRCVVAGIPVEDARLYKTKLLDKEQTDAEQL